MSEPTIKLEPDRIKDVIHYRVLIDGEHRATFKSRKAFGRRGYDLDACDGVHITSRGQVAFEPMTKADFMSVVQKHLRDIPTIAKIERSKMIDQAHRENRERDSEITKHRTQVRRNVLCGALELYIDDDSRSYSYEEKETARTLLDQYRDPDRFFGLG